LKEKFFSYSFPSHQTALSPQPEQIALATNEKLLPLPCADRSVCYLSPF